MIADQNPFLRSDRLVISISPSETLRNRGDPLTVSLEYTLDLVTPFMSDIYQSISLSASCTMMVE